MNKQSNSPALIGINYTIFMLAYGPKSNRRRHVVEVSEDPSVADEFIVLSNRADILMEATKLKPSDVEFELTTIFINMN